MGTYVFNLMEEVVVTEKSVRTVADKRFSVKSRKIVKDVPDAYKRIGEAYAKAARTPVILTQRRRCTFLEYLFAFLKQPSRCRTIMPFYVLNDSGHQNVEGK